MLMKQANQKHTLNHCFCNNAWCWCWVTCAESVTRLCAFAGVLLCSKLCSNNGGDNLAVIKICQQMATLQQRGCPTSIAVLQVFAPTTSHHFLLGPWCWMCFFLHTLPQPGLLLAAEPLVYFYSSKMSLWLHLWPTPRASHQRNWPLLLLSCCFWTAGKALPIICFALQHLQILQNMVKINPAALFCFYCPEIRVGGGTVEVSGGSVLDVGLLSWGLCDALREDSNRRYLCGWLLKVKHKEAHWFLSKNLVDF